MKEDTSTARLIAVEISRPGITEHLTDELTHRDPARGHRWAKDKKAVELLLHLGVDLELTLRFHQRNWLSKTRLAVKQDPRLEMITVSDNGRRYPMLPDPGDTIDIVDNKRNRTWLQEHLPHLRPKPEKTSSSPSGGS